MRTRQNWRLSGLAMNRCASDNGHSTGWQQLMFHLDLKECLVHLLYKAGLLVCQLGVPVDLIFSKDVDCSCKALS